MPDIHDDTTPDAEPLSGGPSIDPCANIARIKADLDSAQAESGSAPHEISIVAVSKKHKSPIIEQLLHGGHRIFGENRVQEAQDKWPSLRAKYADLELHLIGPLQSNKAAQAVALFDVIQSVDRDKIARAIAEECAKQKRCLKVFVQVNTGAEPQKSGVLPEEALEFVERCRAEYGLPVEGLMCIPPSSEAPAPHFALLAKLGAAAGLPCLSMGMSADYQIAAQLGATHVRVGSGIFGPRPQ